MIGDQEDVISTAGPVKVVAGGAREACREVVFSGSLVSVKAGLK